MFTPQEVSEKTFPKSSSFSSGYDLAAVDEFLDTLTEDYTALYKENAALKAKLKILAEKLEEYRATEDTMRSMLLAAQKMAASMTDEAKEKSEKLLADARSQREQILEEHNRMYYYMMMGISNDVNVEDFMTGHLGRFRRDLQKKIELYPEYFTE